MWHTPKLAYSYFAFQAGYHSFDGLCTIKVAKMATSRNKVKPIHVVQVREFGTASNPSDPKQTVEVAVPPTTGKIDVFQNMSNTK